MNHKEEVVVRVNNVSKDFLLPHEKIDSVKSFFINPFRKKRKIEVQHAVRNIDFTVTKGEFFGIVGRNGSGKSTLLKIIAGIYQPTKGDIKVNGRLVPFIELGVGFNPELTGRENVFLNGALMGFSSTEVNKKYASIIEFAELERFMDQKLKNYSSGMQVRLAFSVATILADSDILLIDEVLAVGDADFQRKCFEYFRTLKKNNKTVIFVSHDMMAVREYCDRAVLIEGSELILEGSADKVATAYTKMFIEDRQDVDSSTDEKRWGDNTATFEQVNLSRKKVTQSDSFIEISTRFTVKKNVSNPIVGFSIKSASGVQLLGTNNKIKKQYLGTFESGDKVDATWKIPNIFGDGKHYVDVAVIYDDGAEVADWWEESTSFTVLNEEKTPYVIAPAIDLILSSNKDSSE